MRIIVKGGVWKNTEDEILKAAVMKYGKNQWSRIASLLHRKTAKQCKARWYEWLDPAIKKTDWSREEEEKLLHLAKLFPAQWRTIAPMIGRTAGQCLQHYEKLLDAAQAKDGVVIDEANDPRRLKPGEIDPFAEGKPARPDPIDMDEDEKEMLSEARARLANTVGKKAKRKAREKQLEEARRLASLQKKRELRAAGIQIIQRKKKFKHHIDYNAEIPFEKPAPKGFHDVDAERTMEADPEFKVRTLQELEGKRKGQDEETLRRKDKEKLKEKMKNDVPTALQQLSKTSDEPARKRPKLLLPAPQVQDSELEQIVKVGQNSREALELADESGPSKELLGDYSMTPAAGLPARTPRIPKSEDTILQEAQNLIALTTQQTPLLGGESTPLLNTNFDSVTPMRQVAQTPNVVLRTPAHPGAAVGMTPRRGDGTLAPTPARDTLGINAMGEGATPMSRGFMAATKASLLQGLSSLPKPKNDFSIVAPDMDEDEEAPAEPELEEDAADRDERAAQERAEEEARELARRSQAIQRDLPRPTHINNAMAAGPSDGLSDLQMADKMIKDEMVRLLQADAVKYPVAPVGGLKAPRLEQFSDVDLAKARALLAQETESVMASVGEIKLDDYERLWSESLAEIAFVPSQHRYGRVTLLSQKDRLDGLEKEFQNLFNRLKKDGYKRAAKLEKKTETYIKGYQIRSKGITDKIIALTEEIEQASTSLKCFQALRTVELSAMPGRIDALTQEVEALVRKENHHQSEFAALLEEKDRLLALLEQPDPAPAAAPAMPNGVDVEASA